MNAHNEMPTAAARPTFAEIARRIYGRSASNLHIASFVGDPKDQTAGWKGTRVNWHSEGLEGLRFDPNANVYFSVGLLRPDTKGRTEKNVVGDYLIVIDDVGPKVAIEQVEGLRAFGISPLMVVRTSPGNYQYFYLIDVPVDRLDPQQAGRVTLLRKIRLRLAQGDWGDRAVQDSARYMRAPVGKNGKEKYRDADGNLPDVGLHEWAPDATVSLELFASVVIGPDYATTEVEALVQEPAGTDGGYSATMESGIVALAARIGMDPRPGAGGRVHARCPNRAEHTRDDDTGFAFLSEGTCKCQHDHCIDKTSNQMRDLMFAEYEAQVAQDITTGLVTDAGDGSLRDSGGRIVPRTGLGFLAHHDFVVRYPLMPDQLEAVRLAAEAYAARRKKVHPLLRDLNDRFCQVLGIDRIVDRRPGPYSLYRLHPVEHFKRIQNALVPLGPKDAMIGIGAAWLRDPHSAKFDTIELFEPGTEPLGVFNPYRGLPVATSWRDPPGATASNEQPFVEFVRRVIAGGRTDVGEYVLDWLAWKLQNPLKKPGVNLVLVGGQGTGKSFFATGMAIDMVGSQLGLAVTQERHALGNFNAHLQHKLLVVFDEALYGKDNKSKGVYKNLTTESQIQIEPKGLDLQTDTNRLAIIVTSNSLASVPVEPDDRRATVIQVSDCRKKDHPYFAELTVAWVSGGREAFMQFLLARDVSQFNPRAPLPTPEKAQVAAATSDLPTAFWASLLEGEVAPRHVLQESQDWEKGPVFICDPTLYEAFRFFAKDRGQTNHLPQPAELQQRIEQLCPGRGPETRPRNRKGQQLPRGHEYPSLADCRAANDRAMGGGGS